MVKLILWVSNRRFLPWIDPIVLGLAQGMAVQLPSSSPECRMGPLASKVQLHVVIVAHDSSGEHWLQTLPGRDVPNFYHNALPTGYSDEFTVSVEAATTTSS